MREGPFEFSPLYFLHLHLSRSLASASFSCSRARCGHRFHRDYAKQLLWNAVSCSQTHADVTRVLSHPGTCSRVSLEKSTTAAQKCLISVLFIFSFVFSPPPLPLSFSERHSIELNRRSFSTNRIIYRCYRVTWVDKKRSLTQFKTDNEISSKNAILSYFVNLAWRDISM